MVVGTDGVSVGDTDNPGTARDFSTRPEFEAALAGSRESGSRHSDTLGSDVFYVAVPDAYIDLFEKQILSLFPNAVLIEQVQMLSCINIMIVDQSLYFEKTTLM